MSIKKSIKKSSFLKLVTAFIITLVCSLGLSACTWFEANDTPAGDSAYDADGNLRISATSVSLTRPSGNGGVDENTGSFVWNLDYYLDGENVAQGLDQLFYNTEFFDNPSFTASSRSDTQFLYAGITYKTYNNLEYSVSQSGYYKVDIGTDTVSYDRVESIISADKYTKIRFLEAGTYNGTTQYTVPSNGYYLVEDVQNVTHAARVYTKYSDGSLNLASKYGQNLSTTPYSGHYFRYPSYTISVSGITYQIRVNVNYSNLIFDFNNNQMFKLDTANGATIDNTFSFTYRIGNTGEWISCEDTEGNNPAHYNMASAFEKDGRFYIRFNPMLGKGSTSRYIRVQSNVSHQFDSIGRGHSVYTSPTNFNVYKLTFAISCNNSVEATYESLMYDANKYYFAQTESSINRGMLDKDYFNILTGYFVEGRIVNVDRYIVKDCDYAFQSWTVNGKADNTVVLQDTLPNNHGDFENCNDGYNNLKCLNLHSINNLGVKEVNLTNVANIPSCLGISTKAGITQFAEVLTNDTDVITGSLYAVACSNTASNVVYANIAKVKNFVLSGTVYDGDNFFSLGGNAVLGDVDLYIWKGEVPFARYIARLGDVQFEVLDPTIYNQYLYDMDIDSLEESCTYSNSQFTINNLAWDCYITFGKIRLNNGDETSYTFYSAAMTERDGFYTLDPTKAPYIISDRAGNAIIGTAMNAEKKVEVNIYVTDNAGNNLTPIDETKTSVNGIQYQIISTTNTETDVFGYTTSSVIISLLLPSNCSLTAYNLENINSIASTIYKENAGDPNYILCDIGYDSDSRRPVKTFYYVETKNIPSQDVHNGQTLNCLLYEDNYYQYSHRDQDTTGAYNYYYEYAETVEEPISYTNGGTPTTETFKRLKRHVIKRTTVSNDNSQDTYTLLDYTQLHHSEYSTASDTTDAGSNKISVSFALSYNGHNYTFASQSEGSDISVTAKAYSTDLIYKYKDKNTQDKTNTMYVYYSVKEYKYNRSGENVTEYYYTAPIGKRSTKIVNSDLAQAQTTATWFHSELAHSSNLNELVYSIDGTDINSNGCIMLGADILQIFSGATPAETIDTRFFKAIGEGKSIIADNFYYIKPLGQPADVLISQFFSTDAETIVTESTVFTYYTEGTSDSDYVFVDADGDGVKEYVEDADNQLYPSAPTRYDQHIYQGEVYTEPLGYSYSLGGLLQGTSGQYYEVYIDHVKIDGTNYGYKLNGNTVVTSMNTGIADTAYLYHLNPLGAISYKLYAPDDNTDGKQTLANMFLGQEGNSQVIQNASQIITADGPIYYLTERFYYDIVTISSDGTDTKKLTTEYKIYTYTHKTNQMYEVNLYYDGYDFYISQNTTTVIDNKEYPLLIKLTKDGNKVFYDGPDGTYIEFLKYDGSKYTIVSEFTHDGTDYINLCLYKYYTIPEDENVYNNNPIALGTPLSSAIGAVQEVTPGSSTYEFVVNYYLENAKLINVGIDNNYYSDEHKTTQLYPKTVTIEREGTKNSVVRRAVLASNTAIDIHLLGKVILLGDGEVNVYPSFNYNMPNQSVDILNISDDGLNYFSIDYTTVNAVIQAFPGVKILSGAPYVNPIMYFEVKHKADERAVVDIGLELTNAYYVEVITNALTSTTKNLIYDFSTVSFKDTITNLTQNDYINRMYYVLNKDTQNSIVAYTQKTDGSYEAYLGGTPLTIQNIGLNTDDNRVYTIMVVDENNNYTQPLYYEAEPGVYQLLDVNELIIWESSSTAIEDLPTFDVHNYYVSDNGMVVLTSNGQENEICSKVENLFISGTGSTSTYYDYSEVMIGGFTSAYRVNAKDLDNSSYSGDLQAFWWEDAINISNSYNSTDPYFLTSKEGAVLVASPIVQLYDGEEYENIIYRFKRWAIYSRYNSEILYYNKTLSTSHVDRSNAVMRFTSKEAGYFVFMPIYERVYTINLGTSIHDGPQNLGGSVSVIYDGTSIDMERARIGEDAFKIHFVEMVKTSVNGNSQYYYNDLQIDPILYFTGEFITVTNENTNQTVNYPKFEVKHDIIRITYDQNGRKQNLYFTYKDGQIVNLPIIHSSFNQPGVVEVYAKGGGQYNFKYIVVSASGATSVQDVFARTGQTITGYEVAIDELLSYGYTVNYYLDGVSSASGTSKSKIVFYYTSEGFANGDDYMYAIDIKDILEICLASYDTRDEFIEALLEKGERFATGKIKTFNGLASVADAFVELNYDALPHDFAESNDAFYFSNLAYLASGELYSYIDEETGDEVVYTTQQFKTSYFERDSKTIISAKADLGYRLKDWYLAEYDERTNSWVVSDTALTDTINATYKDIIRNVYNNPEMGTNGTWFYVTDYSEQVGEHYIYYYDEEKTEQAVVATNMLDSVRGYYAKTKDLYGNDIWIPVYRSDYNSGDWYTDATLTTKYTGDIAAIEIRSHYSCIRNWSDGSNNRYLIGNVEVWRNNGNFYRTKDIGNMFFKDSKIYIHNLHNNIRVVAEFIEVYQSFVFAENSTDENIEVVSLYYTGVRSTADGELLDGVDKLCETGMEEKDFYDKEGEEDTLHINDTNYVGLINYSTLTTSTPLLKARDDNGGELVDAKVNLVNMRFDVDSTIYLVVKVYYNKNLNIHTLGMNASYQITPVFYPTDEYINLNVAADEEHRDDHYFYIFKVTYNRDLDYYHSRIDGHLTSSIEGCNYNPEYVVHVNRGKTIVADVLSGNYSKYYSQLFKFYDADNNEVELDFNENGEVRLASSYLSILSDRLTGYGIDTTTAAYEEMVSKYRTNIKSLFKDLSKEYGYIMNFANVSDRTGVYRDDLLFCSVDKVYKVIRNKFVVTDNRITGPQRSGATNFINLSSIPVYTYTTSIKVLSSINESNVIGTDFDEEMVAVLLENGIKLDQTIYTRGGYQGYTYIGIGHEDAVSTSITVNDSTLIYPHKFTGNTDVDINDPNYADMFEQDYALAKDTIMVLGGLAESSNLKCSAGGAYYVEITTDDNDTPEDPTDDTTVKYIFSGWFEQKMVSDQSGADAWGDLQLMSNDINYPYASVAYADTNIIALFERAVDLEINGQKNSATVNFNTLHDSLNNPIEKVYDGNDFKIKGTFTVSSNIAMDITPSGGYRFGDVWGIDINGDDVGFTDGYTTSLYGNGFLAYNQEGLDEDIEIPTFADLNLVKTINVSFNLGQMLTYYENLAKENAAAVVNNGALSDLSRTNNIFGISLNMVQVSLTYITVEGYTLTGASGTEELSGYEFNVYFKSGETFTRIVATKFDNGTVRNIAEGNILDSAQRPINIQLLNSTLSIYGYFDFDVYTDNLFVEYVEQAECSGSLKAWFVNTHSETTNAIVPYAIKDTTFTYAEDEKSTFKISYYYTFDDHDDSSNLVLYDPNTGNDIVTTQALVDEYNHNLFNLSDKNFAYLLTAKIQAKSNLTVSYATIDSIKEVDGEVSFAENGNATLISMENKGSLSWTGALFETEHDVLVNGVKDFVDTRDTELNLVPTAYTLYSDTRVTLSNDLHYYSADNVTFYKFIGWFRYHENNLIFVSESVTCNTSGSGNFVAIFAKLAIIDESYTYTLNTDDGNINQNGVVSITSNYSLTKHVVALTDNAVQNTTSVAINVFGTCSNLYNNGETVPSFMYAVVGSSIKVTVTADTNYLVSDIVFTCNGLNTETSILIGNTGYVTAEGVLDDIGLSDENHYVIIAKLTRGFDVRVVQIYYDTIIMNNVGIEYTDQSFVNVVRADAPTPTPSGAGLYSFGANTVINLTFTEAKNFGLIGYYINDVKIDFATDNEGNFIDLEKRLAEYTVYEDVTIEVRITKYVNARTLAVNEAHDPLNNITTEFTYIDYYTKEEQTYTLIGSETIWHRVLSGTVLSFNTYTDQNSAFVRWEKTERFNEDLVGTEYELISTTPTFELSLEYGGAENYTTDINYTFLFTAVYQQSWNINVEKIISSYNIIDQIYRTVNPDTSITWAPEFWAHLDVAVTYTDIHDVTRTIFLGSKNKLDQPLKAKAGTSLIVSTNISKAVENRYTGKIKINNVDITNGVAQMVNGNKDVKVEFYAKRNVTLVRQVNNQEFTYATTDPINLGVSFTLGAIGAGSENPLETTISRYTWEDVAGGEMISFKATQDSNYTFAGFYVNGIAVGKGINNTGYYAFYVKQGAQQLVCESNLSGDYDTLYTYDTDLTVIALWYRSTNIIAGVNLDGVNILSDEAQAIPALNELSNNLILRLIGNKVTYKDNYNYNTAIQSIIATNENYNDLIYLCNHNLALVASQFAGYQFVGFFYRELGSENFIKLDFCNSDIDYKFGDTLTSILAAEYIEAGKTYYIEARYLSAWQVSQLISVNNQSDTSMIEDGGIADTQFVQLIDDGDWKDITTLSQYDTFAGTNTNDYFIKYFYPHISNYIGVYYDSGIEAVGNGVTPIGYYINGVHVDVIDTVEIDGKNYAVIDILQYINSVSNADPVDRIDKNANQVYDFVNMVIERRYVKNVEYVIRIGVDNTSDITKLNNAAFNDLSIVVSYVGDYVEETTIEYKNTGANTYWNEDNHSLYIKLILPIGTTISTSISADSLTSALLEEVENDTYLYNGWFMYANYSISGSTSVINYTNNLNFVLTNDTDVVAQYFISKISKTTDTQYSYKFNGEDFTNRLYSPAVQGSVTNYSLIAEELTQKISTIEYNTTTLNIEASAATGAEGNEYITITSTDGIIFNVTHQIGFTTPTTYKFMFMGWYQEIKDNFAPSTFLFVTSNLGLRYDTATKPAQLENATNMIAIFTQIVEIKLAYADGEKVNSINYTKLKQNYTQVAPIFFTDVTRIGDYLNTSLLADGTLVWNTLYETNMFFNYYAAYGYHYSTDLESESSAPWDTFKTAEGLVDNGIKNNIDTTTIKLDNDKDYSAIKYLTKNDTASITNTSYNYTVSSDNGELQNVVAAPICKTEDHTCEEVAVALTTSAISTGGAKAGFATINTFTKGFAKAASLAADDGIIIEEGAEDIKSYISGQIVTPNNTATGITFVITIRFPDSTTEELVLDDEGLFALLYEEDAEGNPTNVVRSLPLGTTIYIQTLSVDNRSEILDTLKIYYLDNESDFVNPDLDLSTIDEGNIQVLNLSETNTIVVTEELHQKYLRVVVTYKNIFSIELEDNNNDEGSITIDYVSPVVVETTSNYNVNILTQEHFAFNNILISFTAGELAPGEPNVVETSFLELFHSFNENALNLTDIVKAVENNLKVPVNNWEAELNYDTAEGLYTGALTYVYNEITYVKIEMTFTFSEADDTGYSYITGIESKFAINTNIKIATEYLHVTTVKTNYTIERFDANTVGYISSEKGEETFNLFVFDYEFFTYPVDEKYIAITKLDNLYQTYITGIDDLEFIGYSYAGGILSDFPVATPHLVITEEEYLNNVQVGHIIVVEAVYVEQLITNVGIEVDYYNNEMDETITDNPNLLNTPLDHLTIYVNKEANADRFTDATDTVEVTTNLNKSADVIILDDLDYFSFIKWYVKYDGKYLAALGAGSEIVRYTLDYAALSVDTNLYVSLIEQYKKSEDFTYSAEQTDVYAKYTGTSEVIDLSKLVICAYLKEEVVELSFAYQHTGETFSLGFTENENNIDPTNAYIASALDTLIKVGGIHGDYATGYEHTFLINQIERPAEEVGEKDDYRLIVAYSKGLIEQNEINVTVIASSYANRDNTHIAQTTGIVPVRRIAPEGETNQEYGQSKFLRINGFKNPLGDVIVNSVNSVANAIRLSTNTSTHSISYKLDTTNLYLIELGMAIDKELLIAGQDYNILTINDVVVEAKYNLAENSSYGAASLLVAEGEVVTINVQNFGELEYKATPTGSSYRGMAISNNFTISDLYKLFRETEITPSSGEYYEFINNVPESLWRSSLNMSNDPTDYTNDFYTTLNQYSNYNIPSHETTYTFIASKNTSIVADYIGMFKEQKRFISVLLNSDGSIKYVNNNATQQSYIGENFVITITYNKTDITLDQVINEDVKYTLSADSTIIKTSIEGVNTDDVNLRFDATLGEGDEIIPNIKFVSQACQLAIGLVTEKNLDANITVVFKYVNYNQTILNALSKALERLNNAEPVDEEPEGEPDGEEPEEEPEEDILIYGYHNPAGLADNPNVYMLDLSLLETEDITTYMTSNLNDPDNFPLTTQLNVNKNTKIALLAEKRSGYTFAGFKVVSQGWDLLVNNLSQSIDAQNTMFISKATNDYRTIKLNETDYYYTDCRIDGNASVIAVYEPNLYLVNISKLTYDEQLAGIANGQSFNPNPNTDEATTQGKILSHSLVISSGDIIELTILTNGFAEYKGIATGKLDSSVKAIYSTMGTLNNPDTTTVTSKKNENESFKQAIDQFNTLGDETNTEYTGEFEYVHYSSVDNPTDISEGITRGYITGGKLFTDDYSTNDYGNFKQNLASVSYLYLLFGEISNDVNLYAYFNAIYYNLNFELNEMEYGYTDELVYTNPDDIDDKVLGNSPYISFNKFLRDDEGWVNPSADSVTGLSFGIADTDPYVYTWFDNTGKQLAYPVKLTRQMITKTNPDDEYNYLTLRQFENDHNTIKNVYSQPHAEDEYRLALTTDAMVNGETKTINTFSDTYKSGQLDNIYNYVITGYNEDVRTYKMAENLFTITINGDTINSGDLVATETNIRKNLSYDDNFIELNNIPVNGLASVSVKVNFAPNTTEPTIKLRLKVFADKNSGFPAVSIDRAADASEICDGSLMFSSAYIIEDDGTENIDIDNASGLSGMFFCDAFIANEETGYLMLDTEKYPDLSINAILAYARASKYSEAKVSFSNLNGDSTNVYDVMITNPSKGTGNEFYISEIADATNDNNQISLLNWINYKYHHHRETNAEGWCDQCKMFHNCNNGMIDGSQMPNCEMIDNYFMYTITNAQMYIDAIEDAADRKYITKAAAIDFISELLAFNPASNLHADYASDKSRYDSLPKYGDIFDYLEFKKDTLTSILWVCGYYELYYRLCDPNCTDLYFTQLDVYSNFKNNINKNFYGNSLNFGDLLVNACKLSEHTAPHQVSYDLFGGIWEEYESSYKYVNNSTADYGVSEVNDAYYSHFDNNFNNEIANAAVVPVTNKKAIANWFAGIANGKKKYAGTYNYVIHSGLMPNTKEFADKSTTTFINTVKVDLSDTLISFMDEENFCNTGRIKTERLNKVHGNLIIAIGEIVVGVGFVVGAIVAGIYSAGTGTIVMLSLAGALFTSIGIYDTVMVAQGHTAESLTPLHNYINNLDFSFD